MTKPSKTEASAPPKDQKDIAAEAERLKQAKAGEPEYLARQTQTPGQGPIAGLNTHEPVMGALDAEGHRPALERSRKVR